MGSRDNDSINSPVAPRDLRASVIRPRDLLALEFQFINLALRTGPHRLERTIADKAAYIIVHFPAQSIAEKAFLEDAADAGSLPVDARMAGPSRLVFKVPDEVTSIAYSVDALLAACRTYALSVAPPGGSAIPHLPGTLETAIEAPFRLILSPSEAATWSHASQPLGSKLTQRVELWHTQLKGQTSGGGTARAIWSRDPGFSGTNALSIPSAYVEGQSTSLHPFRMPLDAAARHKIVHQTSNFSLTRPSGGGAAVPYEPKPITINQLMLTSLGAWLDARGTWEQPLLGLDLLDWEQRSAQGRDHFVRVVKAGSLFPLGHRAAVVTVTERRFRGAPSGSEACLYQETRVVLLEPVRTYGGAPVAGKEAYDRQMPFKQIRILTRATPVFDPSLCPTVPGTASMAFWPSVDGNPFRFHVEAIDAEGNASEFTLPLLFVPTEITDAPLESSTIQAVRAAYESSTLRTATLGGQKVVYASGGTAGNTRFETESVTFGAKLPEANEYNALPIHPPRFFPVIEEATLRIPAMRHLTGGTAAPRVRFFETYVTKGFGGADNKGEVFLELLSPEPMSFDSVGDKVGGLVKPNMKIQGLSRSLGPVAGDLGQLSAGKFSPKDFFEGLDAKVFGVINLWDIIQEVEGFDEALDLVPRFVTQALERVEQFRRELDALSALLLSLPSTIATQAADVRNRIAQLAQAFVDAAQAFAESGSVDTSSFGPRLTALGTALDVLAKAMPGAGIPPGVRRELDKAIRQIREVLESVSQANGFLKQIEAVIQALKVPEELSTRFEWRPRLRSWGPDSSKPIFIPRNEHGLRIAVEARVKTAALTRPSFDVTCSLENFDLDLIAPASLMVLHFDRLQFIIENGKKPEVDAIIGGIEFVGVLSFIETLKNLIPLDGFSDPPALEATSQGITASYSVALPNVAVGMFSLENLSLGAALNIPFIGDPLSVRFNFCERDSPFVLTVSSIGGGGFFGLTVTPSGVQLLEAAFEFGASLSINFGVASGSVSIMAGIYFKMKGKEAALTGYLRIRGEVSVLGIISCAIELRMDLAYEFSSGKVVGRASLMIEIEVLFFSKTVELSCERKFAGSNGDPTLRQVLEPDVGNPLYRPWDEYCQAFAT
jgi:hypothetical protein